MASTARRTVIVEAGPDEALSVAQSVMATCGFQEVQTRPSTWTVTGESQAGELWVAGAMTVALTRRPDGLTQLTVEASTEGEPSEPVAAEANVNRFVDELGRWLGHRLLVAP